MEVITIDSRAFNEILTQLGKIFEFVLALQGPCEQNEDNEWVDSFEVCTFLQISDRTLQRLRANGEISYSRIRGKNYYKLSEVRRMLDDKLIKSKKEYMNDLIGHRKRLREKCQKGNSANYYGRF